MGVRKNANSLTPAEVAELSEAFEAAYQLGDDRGFGFYAGIHGLPLPTYCEHGTALFLPWHRAYLYFFERALTDALGRARGDETASVNLPWWDWSSNVAHFKASPLRSNPLKTQRTRSALARSCSVRPTCSWCATTSPAQSAMAMNR
jgi:tyrosinase